jgi:hypothetical protein
MTYFLKHGNIWTVSSKESLDLHEMLPPANYVVKKNEMSGQFFLEVIDSFALPSKIYGSTIFDATRILSTFGDRSNSTGVLLTGQKGSGKTLLAKKIAMAAAAQEMPTIIINTPHFGEVFNTFIQDIDQPCVILFDEFEKVYDRTDQEHILTLLDGVFSSKKLFVLTCNDKWKIDSHMRNRPGRIFYMLEFDGLDIEFVREYCKDRLINQSHTEAVCKISKILSELSFDMLQALVEEMNRYDETPQEAMRMLNIKPEFSADVVYEITQVALNNKPTEFINKEWIGNPLAPDMSLQITYFLDEEQHEYVAFDSADLSGFDAYSGTFTFQNADGIKAILIRKQPRSINFLTF